MNNVTEEQIENIVDNAISKVSNGILDTFINIYNDFGKVIEENPKLKGGEMSFATIMTSIHIGTKILKESLKDLLKELLCD